MYTTKECKPKISFFPFLWIILLPTTLLSRNHFIWGFLEVVWKIKSKFSSYTSHMSYLIWNLLCIWAITSHNYEEVSQLKWLEWTAHYRHRLQIQQVTPSYALTMGLSFTYLMLEAFCDFSTWLPITSLTKHKREWIFSKQASDEKFFLRVVRRRTIEKSNDKLVHSTSNFHP